MSDAGKYDGTELVSVHWADAEIVGYVNAQKSAQGKALNNIVRSLYRMFGDRRVVTFNPDGGSITCGPGIGMTAEQAEAIGLYFDLDHLVSRLGQLERQKRGC